MPGALSTRATNVPRIGRVVVERGRDAADIPLINSFGPHVLKSFRVWTYEVERVPPAAGSPTAIVDN